MRQIDFNVYTGIWRKWCRDWKHYVRWGQFLCDELGVDPPGLWAAQNVRQANEIFWEHFKTS